VCSSEAPGTTTSVSQQTGTSSGQTDTITGCKYPSGDAVTGSALFVACAGSGVVAGCATTSTCATGATTVALNKPAGGVTPVPSGVAGVGFAPVPTVIVADARNSTLSLVTDTAGILSAGTPVKLASGCVPATVAVGPTTANTADVYVACPGNGTIEVGTVSGTPPSLGTFTATALPTTGSHTPSPYGIAVNAAGTDLVVTDSANNDAVVYPSLSGATLGTGNVVAVGTEPDGVGMDGGNAFIANEGSGNVSVVDPIDAGKNTGHYVSAHARGATLRPSLLTPLIAPVPAGSIR